VSTKNYKTSSLTYMEPTTKTHEHWICSSQAAGLSPSWAPLRSGLGQAIYTNVPLSPSSIIWYWPRAVMLCGGIQKVTAAYHRVYGKVTRGLTAKRPGSALSPMLIIKYGTTLPSIWEKNQNTYPTESSLTGKANFGRHSINSCHTYRSELRDLLWQATTSSSFVHMM